FQPFPRTQRLRPSLFRCKVGVHIGLFEACSTFTGDYWGRAKNQRRFRAFGERHQRRLSPCLDPPTPRKNCLLICLVPRERVAIPNLLPRFDRGRCLEEAGQRLWLAEMSQLSDSPFTFLAHLACARTKGPDSASDPNERFYAKHPRQEPYAVTLHVQSSAGERT